MAHELNPQQKKAVEHKSGPLLIIAGAGITPARSMLIYLANKGIKIPFTLIASFSKNEDILFREELAQTESELRKVNYHISQNLERIEEKIIKPRVTDFAKTRFMVSGPVSFVTNVRKMIKKMGAKEENIEYEDFSGYK